MLREKRLSEPQRLVLEQDLARFEAVLNGIGPDPEPLRVAAGE